MGLLFARSGRRLRTYTGLVKAHRRRGSVAVVGRDLLFGSRARELRTSSAGRSYIRFSISSIR
jgi:hypothetical protein